MTDPAFPDLVGQTPAPLAALLRASVLSDAAAVVAAVEMLTTAYEGLLLKAPPIRDAIRRQAGHVAVDWGRLAELAHLMDTRERQLGEVDIPDVIAIYQTGLPANSRHVLATIAALGNREIGVREAVVLAGAYQQVALASHDWTAADVQRDQSPLSFTFSVTLAGDLLDRLHAAAAARSRTPIDVIREVLDDALPGPEEASLPPQVPPGLARPDGT